MTNLLKKPLFWTNVVAFIFAGWLIAGLVFGWTNPNQNPPGGAGVITASAGKVGIASSTPGVTLGVTGNALINGTFQSNTVKTNYVKATSPADFSYFSGNILVGTQSIWTGTYSPGTLRISSDIAARIDLRDLDSSGNQKNFWRIVARDEPGSEHRLDFADLLSTPTVKVTIDQTGKLSAVGTIYTNKGFVSATDGITFPDGKKQTSTAVGGIYTTDGLGACVYANPVTSNCNCNAAGYTAVLFLRVDDAISGFGNNDRLSYQCFIQ